jgi:hypothetical protein
MFQSMCEIQAFVATLFHDPGNLRACRIELPMSKCNSDLQVTASPFKNTKGSKASPYVSKTSLASFNPILPFHSINRTFAVNTIHLLSLYILNIGLRVLDSSLVNPRFGSLAFHLHWSWSTSCCVAIKALTSVRFNAPNCFVHHLLTWLSLEMRSFKVLSVMIMLHWTIGQQVDSSVPGIL